MKVLIFARNTVAHRVHGGMEVVLGVLSAALKREGAELCLVTTGGYQADLTSTTYSVVHVIPRTTEGRYSSEWWRQTRRAGPWDNFSATAVIGIGDAAAGYLSRPDRVTPVIVQTHGTPLMEADTAFRSFTASGIAKGVLNLFRIPSRKKQYEQADHIWAVGPALPRSIERMASVSNKIEVLPNSVDGEHFRARPGDRERVRSYMGISGGERVGIYFGRLIREKGVQDVFAAVNDRHGLDRLIVAGDGPYRSKLESRIRSQGLSDRVVFTGAVSSDRLRELLAASDISLLPTKRREGLPMSLLESAAAGLPVIATPYAAVPADISAVAAVKIISAKDKAGWSRAIGSVTVDTVGRRNYLPEQYLLDGYGRRHLRSIQKLLADSTDASARSEVE